MKTGSISVPSGVGLPIDSHSLSPVCLGAFSKFRNPSNVLHICGKATLRDYHVVNYIAFHLRGCLAGRMGCSPRWSLPVALLAGVCTLLTPTAIPAPTLFAKGLHQCSLIFTKECPSSVGTDANKWIWGLFCAQTRNVPQSGWLSWWGMVLLGDSVKPRYCEVFPQVLQLGHTQDAQ